MLRIITINLNGIRSAERKGFYSWLATTNADIICMQEIKAQLPDLSAEMLNPNGYQGFFHPAEKKGYSGVGIYTRIPPKHSAWHLNIPEIDSEGRYLRLDFEHFSVISLYLPSGSSGPHRQEAKFAFMDHFYPILDQLLAEQRDIILCGDWNIAHQQIDLKNWRSNQKNSGFLPEERDWLSRVFAEQGWVDAFRVVNQEAEQYTWWSNRGQAWAKNVGWRIDYQIVTPALKDKISTVSIYKDQRFSDHAPLIIDYALEYA